MSFHDIFYGTVMAFYVVVYAWMLSEFIKHDLNQGAK